ncbi:1,3-beta-glucanosyltransferase [Castilleja foliolosa]|uniref:1,3-beta-glucanosyltransferase n=1 Tax=Castilleja foliolosa TaxID=1961234 RepID=A0ABD3E6A5_9LAMI
MSVRIDGSLPSIRIQPGGLLLILLTRLHILFFVFKRGPYRATFLLEYVSDLRKNLQYRGTDLVVRVGRPETVLLEVVKAVGADAVYMHREVSHDEVKAEEKIEEAMKDEGIEVKYYWGSTLYHLEDLPLELTQMPTNYGGFKDKVKGLEVRKTIEGSDKLKGLPKKGGVDPGEIPSLADLGLNRTRQWGRDIQKFRRLAMMEFEEGELGDLEFGEKSAEIGV